MNILINFFTIAVLLLFMPVYAEAHNWVYVGETEGDLWLVDSDSIICKGNNCNAWIKIVSRASTKRLSIEKEEYTKSLHEYNCTWMEYRILQTGKYDLNGNELSSASPTELAKKYVVPESIKKELHGLVCRKSSLQKEQPITEEKYSAKKAEEAQKNAPVQPQEVVSPKKMKEERKKIKEEPLKHQKPSRAIFTVQVGAFSNASFAKSLKTTLSKKGYKVYIITVKSGKERKLYKVWIGKFNDREKAERLSEKMKKTEGLQAFVTLW